MWSLKIHYGVNSSKWYAICYSLTITSYEWCNKQTGERMKKIILSAAVAAMAFSTSAMAADKGIDIDVGGQAVVYYETNTDNSVGDKGLFDKDESMANVGIQLDLGADLGNNFTFGSQLTYVGTAGLEKNLVSSTRTSVAQSLNNDLTTQIMLTKIFVAKKIGNTTLKIGRQELPKSLSPLAFTEGWNVFKNTFDAIVAINTDLPDTTLVGAYVSDSNDVRNLDSTTDLVGDAVAKGAYLITVQTKVIPMTTLTASYYHLSGVGATAETAAVAATTTTDSAGDTVTLSPAVAYAPGSYGDSADAIWIDAQVKPMDMLTIAGQYGNLDSDAAGAKDTDAFGVKATIKLDALTDSLAYTDVNDGALAVVNTGGIKTPLYTQMVYNQNFISSDNSTVVAKVSYNMGDAGSITAAYGMSDDDNTAGVVTGIADDDYNEFDLIYKVKAGGVQYFAAYINRDFADRSVLVNGMDEDHKLRVWARYNF